MIQRTTILQILRFGFTGVVATLVHYGIYYLLMQFINMNIAFAVGYFLSFILNYIMSARFTFKKKTTAKNGLGFCLAHIINFLLQISLLNLFVWIGVMPKFAPIPVYSICIPVNFLLVRFVFNRK